MWKAISIVCALALTGCAALRDQEEHAETTQPTQPKPPEKTPEPNKPTNELCHSETKAIVRKNLPNALRYPANSAHREMYINLMDVYFRSLLVGKTNYEIAMCQIEYKYAIQEYLVRNEEAHGLR
jgi:hypothetical protein